MIDVPPEGYDPLALMAQPKSARLSFDLTPPDTRVTFRGVTRTARETMNNPFEVKFDLGSALGMRQLEYEVSLGNYREFRFVPKVSAGELHVEKGTFDPQ